MKNTEQKNKLVEKVSKMINLDQYSTIYEKQNSKILGYETSDVSFSEIVLLGSLEEDIYIYIANLKQGHIKEPELVIKIGNKGSFLEKSNYTNANGFENEWHREGSKAVLDFEKLKEPQKSKTLLESPQVSKRNKL